MSFFSNLLINYLTVDSYGDLPKYPAACEDEILPRSIILEHSEYGSTADTITDVESTSAATLENNNDNDDVAFQLSDDDSLDAYDAENDFERLPEFPLLLNQRQLALSKIFKRHPSFWGEDNPPWVMEKKVHSPKIMI